jgi:protein arginine N-methyltransferase 1
VIKGQLTCAPNARNNRDLDIEIEYEVEGSEAVKGQMTYKMCVPVSPQR